MTIRPFGKRLGSHWDKRSFLELQLPIKVLTLPDQPLNKSASLREICSIYTRKLSQNSRSDVVEHLQFIPVIIFHLLI